MGQNPPKIPKTPIVFFRSLAKARNRIGTGSWSLGPHKMFVMFWEPYEYTLWVHNMSFKDMQIFFGTARKKVEAFVLLFSWQNMIRDFTKHETKMPNLCYNDIYEANL